MWVRWAWRRLVSWVACCQWRLARGSQPSSALLILTLMAWEVMRWRTSFKASISWSSSNSTVLLLSTTRLPVATVAKSSQRAEFLFALRCSPQRSRELRKWWGTSPRQRTPQAQLLPANSATSQASPKKQRTFIKSAKAMTAKPSITTYKIKWW